MNYIPGTEQVFAQFTRNNNVNLVSQKPRYTVQGQLENPRREK